MLLLTDSLDISVTEPFDTLERIRDKTLDEFFEENEGSLRPWQTTEWAEQREKHLEDECEWCGNDDDPLQIHHTSGTPQWSREWIHATDAAFIDSTSYDASYTQDRAECPSCGLRSYYERKTKEPTYRCNECKSEFDNPRVLRGSEVVKDRSYDTKPYVTYEFYEAKAEWLKSNKSKSKKAFEKHFENLMKEYISMTETITICQSCHFQEERTRNRRCSKCGEQFHKPNKPMCWDCLVEEKGLQRCTDCENGWYQPSKYSSCSDCRTD